SAADSNPSATTAVECPDMPATILITASAPETNIPVTATRCPVCILIRSRVSWWGKHLAGGSACPTLCPRGVDLFGVYSQFGEGGDRLLGVEFAIARQPGKRGGGDGFRVDLKVAPQVLAVVAAPETVAPQRFHASRQPRRNLVGHHLHIVAGCDDGPVRALQRLEQIRRPLGLVRMQAVPALHTQRVAAQLVVAGGSPYVGGDLVLLRQDPLRAQGFIEDRPAAEQVYSRLAVLGRLETVQAAQHAL